MVKSKLTSSKGFYVGDICYVLDDDFYDKEWGSHDYADGEYETEFGKFAVGSTAYGDGEYADIDGHEYSVDAGVIGIVPWEILEKQSKWKTYYKGLSEMEQLNKLGRFFEGKEAEFWATCRGEDGHEDGRFDIWIDGDGGTEIYTGCDDEEEEYEEDEYDPYEFMTSDDEEE